MKKRIQILLSVAMLSTSAMAQKLSPSLQMLLTNANNSSVKVKSIAKVNKKENTIGAFLRVDGRDTIEKLKEKGFKINNIVSDSLVTATLKIDQIKELSEIEGVKYIQAATSARLLLDKARADAGVDVAQSETNGLGAFTGKGIVIGIVDTGFYSDHIDFYSSDRKRFRIKKYWQQDQWPGKIYKSPEGFDYGRELTDSASITRMHYDLSGQSHATHVAGIASGADKDSGLQGVAPDADLVIVSTDLQGNHVIDGVKYCFDYAESVGKPCVVNLSIGDTFGPRDGASETDEALNAMAGPGRIIIGAAGNDGKNIVHAAKTFSAGDEEMKAVLNCSFGQTAAAEIWGTQGENLSVKAMIVDMTTGKTVSESDLEDTSSPKGVTKTFENYGTIQMASEVYPANKRPHVQVVASFSYIPDNMRLVLSIKGENGGQAHVWAALSSAIEQVGKEGYTDGDNKYTVNEIGGTGKNVVSVGSYNTRTLVEYVNGTSYDNTNYAGKVGSISAFSSVGPTLDGRQKPDVAAPGAEIYSAAVENGYAGFAAKSQATKKVEYGGKEYYYVENQGTSMAAPFVTGTVALWLQAKPSLTPEEVREIISKSSRSDSSTGDVPNYRFGFGKIDAMEGLRKLASASGINDTETTQKLYRIVTDRNAKTIAVYFAGQGEKARLTVYNSLGQQVVSAEIPSSGYKANVSDLNKGVYIVKLQVGKTTQSVKVAL